TVFSLEPFIVNIYDGQELRYLKVKVELEMAGPAIKAELDGRLAAIRDAILVVLTTKTLQEVQDAQGKNQLREEILTAISKIVAQGKVTKVYFTDFVVQ
ncbi:MAG: flagellar basal body-associated FliL family protein, partial [Deltaproteobacteria bacterium]|nr:flagellar basal body-associated FliL family protein [Deltaproteobacteria bacterium]